MVYTVSRRTGEIGMRMALGAAAGDIVWLIMRDGLRLAVAGVAIGLGLAAGGARLMSGMLFGVTAADPLVFVVVPLALVATAACACALPSFRAARVDPMVALRSE